jgi:ABC-type nitrate/sulfonate/bicarbonate transport system substrate-binding protein
VTVQKAEMTNATQTFAQRAIAFGAAALLAAGSLTACGSSADGGEVTTVRYQSEQGLLDLIQMGEALNYFPTLKFTKRGDVTSGPSSLQALVSNQIDISQQAFFGAVAQVVASGAPIKAVVSSYGANAKVHSSLVTLVGSPITKPQDLLGKKIAVNTLGGNDEAVIDTYLQKSGLTGDQIKQITLVVLPPLNTAEALQKHQIDVAYLKPGQMLAAQNVLQLATLATDVDVVGDYNAGGYAMTDQFLKRNPHTSQELVTGVAKAVKYVETQPVAQVLKVYTTWLKNNGFANYVEPIEKNYPGDLGVASTIGAIAEGDVSKWIPWLKSRGDIDTSKIVASDVYTNQYNLLAPGSTPVPGALRQGSS